MKPLISVIIPVYNAEAYLSRCVDSILAQTCTDWEIILVDDGSTDGSGTLCDTYAARDSRIRVLHQPNVGIGATRNNGVAAATGSFLAFVDADDSLFPHALELLHRRLNADGSDMVIGNHVRSYEDGHCDAPYHHYDAPLLTPDALRRKMKDIRTIPVCSWGKLFKRELFNGLSYPATRVGEDMLLFPLLVDRCRLISMENEPLWYYFQRSDSLMRDTSNATLLGHLYATLTTARYLWDHQCVSQAAAWYAIAAKNALSIANRKKRLGTFSQLFDASARRTLYRLMPHSGRIARLCMHLPFVHCVFRRHFSKKKAKKS